MTFIDIKVFCSKYKVNIIQLREYKNFNNEAFMNDLQQTCFQDHNFETLSFENVKEISDEILTWF